jgi:uncharacterized protein
MADGYFAALALATLIGLALGALGGGGSIITTPVLVYVAHIPPDRAVGMSLFIVGATSLVGAILHLRRGNIAHLPVALFSVTGMVGSFLGASATHLVSSRTLMLVFASIMIIVGVAMWRGPNAYRESGRANSTTCLAVGFAIGLLTGFIGVGGGFLIVPALVLFAGIDCRKAMGTSLAVITFNSTTGLLGQLRFVRFEWGLVWGFLALAIAGMIVGIRIAKKLPDSQLRRLFAVTVMFLGAVVGIQNLT